MPGKEGPRWVGCVRGRGGSLGGGGGKHSKTVVGGLREGGWLGGGRGIGTGSWEVLRGGVRGRRSGECVSMQRPGEGTYCAVVACRFL